MCKKQLKRISHDDEFRLRIADLVKRCAKALKGRKLIRFCNKIVEAVITSGGLKNLKNNK